ncbi:MAG: hypothetical protein LBI42_04700 [Chitinispirillales bacterium]|jgi:hypothetical protein|nr:hypothetical protein [Chitinispirillales bacterium]
MKEAIGAYPRVSATEEFQQLVRLRERTRYNETAALGNAERKGMAKGIAKGIVKGRAEGAQKLVELIEKGIPLPEAMKMLGVD